MSLTTTATILGTLGSIILAWGMFRRPADRAIMRAAERIQESFAESSVETAAGYVKSEEDRLDARGRWRFLIGVALLVVAAALVAAEELLS